MSNQKQENLAERAEQVYKIIQLCRNSNGWKSETFDASLDVIESWTLIFNHYQIPTVMLQNLFFRTLDMRQRIIQDGKKPPELNAETLCLNWTGTHGLKAELDLMRVEEIRRANPDGKFINDGKLKCRLCFGSGFREVFRFGYRGAIRCLHEENYVLDARDEVVGGDEGIRIIQTYLAKLGIEFEEKNGIAANVVKTF